MNESEVMLRGSLLCCPAQVVMSKGTFPSCHPTQTQRGASLEVLLPAKKVPAVNSVCLVSRKQLTTVIIFECSVCVTLPGCQELFWALPPVQMLLRQGAVLRCPFTQCSAPIWSFS